MDLICDRDEFQARVNEAESLSNAIKSFNHLDMILTGLDPKVITLIYKAWNRDWAALVAAIRIYQITNRCP